VGKNTGEVVVAESRAATVVLVHGARAGAWCWSLVGEELDSRGIEHLAVDLPTVGFDVDPTLNFHADATYVRALLDELDRPVLLCGNSYGGLVITEASAGHPCVARLVYLAALMPDAQDDLLTFVAESCTPQFLAAASFTDDGLFAIDPEMQRALSLHQSPAEVADWAVSQARPMAMATEGTLVVTGVGWRGIPSTYVVSTDDRAIQPEVQRRWAAERATDSVELPFDHSPHLSHPVEIAELLARLATAAVM
jgi:pimeloyl-ACP methyl ester carboxylesterase